MSGPKVIDYQAIERRNAEVARRCWRELCGRADALRQRCEEAGHPDLAVDTGSANGDSDAINRQCEELDRAIESAADALTGRQLHQRTQQVMADMAGVLADLERREQQQRQTQQADAAAGQQTAAAAPAPAVRTDYRERVQAKLASLLTVSRELTQSAEQVLAATDESRARLLYADLSDRVEEANRRTRRADEQSAQIAELHAHVDQLPDPEPVRLLLAQAADNAGRGQDAQALLAQARDAITAQLDAAAAAADRVFVRQAVADSLTELGYQVLDVDVETPESLVLRQNSSHGVRAELRDGALNLEPVRLGPADADSDRDAEDEFCRRVPGVLEALSRRGVAANVRTSTLPGLITPKTVKVGAKKTKPAAQQAAQAPEVRKRSAR